MNDGVTATGKSRIYKGTHTFGGQVPPVKKRTSEEALREAANAVITDYAALGEVRAGTVRLCEKAVRLADKEKTP